MRGLGLDAVQTGSIFDEIRGASLNAMLMGRMAGGAIHAAGGVGKFAINAGPELVIQQKKEPWQDLQQMPAGPL